MDVPGVWLGIDVGSVRVGIAKSDALAQLASPLATLRRDTKTDRDIDKVAELVIEHEVVGVAVGLPKTLANREELAAALARDYASKLHARISPTRIVFVDERLTTVTASRTLSRRGIRGRAQRAVIDQAAAVVILQQWLDAGREC
jgi:putative holliday junction resolvase